MRRFTAARVHLPKVLFGAIHSVMKRCALCREMKPPEAFWRDISRPDGLRSRCRLCANATRDHDLQRKKKWNKENTARHTLMSSIWRTKNREASRNYARDWRKKNKEMAAAHGRRKRAKKLAAEGNHTPNDIFRIAHAQRNRCAYCRKTIRSNYHIDHINPLSAGGSNFANNLQLLCAPCNMKKSSKHPLDFARSLGLLI
jgi:5-methylcytosine-specific restriction endonuclease McrA